MGNRQNIRRIGLDEQLHAEIVIPVERLNGLTIMLVLRGLML